MLIQEIKTIRMQNNLIEVLRMLN